MSGSSRPNYGKRLRAGQAFANITDPALDSAEPSSKKLRFDPRNPSNLLADGAEADDDDDDAVLELDTIGKAAGAAKHSAVNLDGFESDSDDDNFNVRAAEKARAQKRATKGQKDDEDDDDDMFGDLEEDEPASDEDPDLAVKKRKTVKYMDEADIEGQVYSSTTGSKVFDIKDRKGNTKEEESDSESGGDEGRDHVDSDIDQEIGAGGKKKHAPKIDAFNMRAEGEEGKFDESGNFIRQADPNAIHDLWLEGVSKKEMKRAREAEQKREEERRRKNKEEDSILQSDILSTLITHLQKGETPLEALQRLGTGKQRTKPKWKKSKNTNGNAMDTQPAEDPEDEAESRRKEVVGAITEAADSLLRRGQEEIYDAERELLQRQYKRETGEDWVDKPTDTDENGADSNAQWHFRWADARDGGTLHGPYDSQTMKSWIDAGYFAGGDVEFKEQGRDDWVKGLE
jgi:CD2 antigen cytoplasmic tail-binding protein 2